MKGMFIVFEGIDGSGKSSVCKRLAKELENVVITAEPTDSKIGMLIRTMDVSRETEALLFVADRADHTVQIKKWVDDGKIVICDRYYASTLAYQSAPLNGPALPMGWLEALNEKVIIEPDMTFLFDVKPEVGLTRVSSRGQTTKFEKQTYLENVRKNYLEIAKRKGFTIIDAERPANDVFREILEKIKEGKNAPV
jgi:thymidylate kinase